jgi:hypothetical protein
MKPKPTILAAAIAVLFLPTLQAQEVVRETVTTSSGVVSQFDPETFVVTTEGAAPIRYNLSKTTTYVDEAGNPVTFEVIKRGAPVTVHYSRSGDALVANRVIVRGGATATTVAPLETAGTLAEFTDGSLAVRTETAPAPVRYSYTKTTKWVDEDGNVVTRETVKTGAPVRIVYTRVGDRMEVDKVIVRRAAGPAIIEKKTTTTTTTETEKKKDDDDDDD